MRDGWAASNSWRMRAPHHDAQAWLTCDSRWPPRGLQCRDLLSRSRRPALPDRASAARAARLSQTFLSASLRVVALLVPLRPGELPPAPAAAAKLDRPPLARHPLAHLSQAHS